jgi:hypothetical protein
MDFFYDGQIRRYITQFMRVFIGFKYQAGDGEQRHVPVLYGDMTRQVASIIKDNSENKLPTVPRIACYVTGLELDTTRLSDSTFVSKVQIRERAYETVDGTRQYTTEQGAGYTVERLMPTPFKLKMKAEIWTSNTDQKLQLLEQILVLFNPSLEVQTTDNYIDWTSLSVVFLSSTVFSSRTIPQGVESDIDIATLEFEMPIYISPPAKVKKLGVVKAVVANMFSNTGDALNLNQLVYNGGSDVQLRQPPDRYGIVMINANNGNPYDFIISVVDVGQAVLDAGLDLPPDKIGKKLEWALILNKYEGYKEGDRGNFTPGLSRMAFLQPNGSEMYGSFVVNPLDPTQLIVSIFPDTISANSNLTVGKYPDNSVYNSIRTNSLGTIDAIINPYNFNPLISWAGYNNYPSGLRYLMLDDVNIYLKPAQAASTRTNIIDTDIDFYRIVRPDQKQNASVSNLPTSYRQIYQTKVYVNEEEVSFVEVENGGKFENFNGTDYRTESGKYRIRLNEFPPLEDDQGNPTIVEYIIEKYFSYDFPDYNEVRDPETQEIIVRIPINTNVKTDRKDGPDAWKNEDGTDRFIKANSIIEWDGSKWATIFDPDEVQSIRYITNLRTGTQYKWDGVQWLKSFEGEYAAGYWRFDMNP